jgi:hypothetical protein
MLCFQCHVSGIVKHLDQSRRALHRVADERLSGWRCGHQNDIVKTQLRELGRELIKNCMWHYWG